MYKKDDKICSFVYISDQHFSMSRLTGPDPDPEGIQSGPDPISYFKSIDCV